MTKAHAMVFLATVLVIVAALWIDSYVGITKAF